MIDELRYLGESESILVSGNTGGTQDSSVTVKAGSPIYLITSERKLPQDELHRLKANLERLIDDPDCSKFIEKLNSNLPDSNTVQTLMEERNVTRAAERLGITQPALSNALGRLRDMLHDPLFIRERYGMRPTPFAEEVAPSISEALAKLDEVVLGQQGFDPAKATRQFTIAPNSYAEFVLAPAIVARLREQAPGISLRLTPYGNDIADTGVMSGTTALALGRMVDPPDNLGVQHLMDDGLDCVVRADHPEIGATISRQQ